MGGERGKNLTAESDSWHNGFLVPVGSLDLYQGCPGFQVFLPRANLKLGNGWFREERPSNLVLQMESLSTMNHEQGRATAIFAQEMRLQDNKGPA